MLRGVTRPSWLIHRASSQGRAQFWALATRPLKQLARAGATEEKPLLWPEEKTKDSTESLQGHGRAAQGDEEGRLTPSAVERCGRHELPSACSQQRKPAVLSVTRTATMWLVGALPGSAAAACASGPVCSEDPPGGSGGPAGAALTCGPRGACPRASPASHGAARVLNARPLRTRPATCVRAHAAAPRPRGEATSLHSCVAYRACGSASGPGHGDRWTPTGTQGNPAGGGETAAAGPTPAAHSDVGSS